MKTFKEVKLESTCQKRIVVCEIYDINNNLLSRESNRCNPNNNICLRLNLYQEKDNYDINSTCNWTHAEINAINNLPINSQPYKSILYGHEFYCINCENALLKIGIKIFKIK